jgi:recombination protein RecA
MAQSKQVKKEDKSSQKIKALTNATDQINKQFGAGTIMKLGDNPVKKVDVIPTGALSLDIALGVGGIPQGRIIEIFGPESSGKTTVALHIVAEAQKQGGVAAFIDAEHALDPQYARNIGINVDDLFVSQPDYGEQALEVLETLVRSGAVDVIVIDSVAALTPKAELDGDMGDAHMGLQARLMSQALRKITAITGKTHTTVIFLNQIRMKIGVMFGNPETTTGGNALKFYSSVRMDIRRRDRISQGDNIVGNVVEVNVVKNKVAPPFRKARFSIVYPNGIDKYSSIVDAAVQTGVIIKSGAWFKMGATQLGQGQDAVRETLKGDNKLTKSIVDKVREEVAKATGV